jgi:hypothetical protein
MLEVRDALAAGGKAAERVERRLGVMARHVADQLNKARKDQRAADADATEDGAAVAEELAVRLENLSGVISAPLQLREPTRRRRLHVCGSPRDECLAFSEATPEAAAHCYGPSRASRRRSRSAALIQVSYQVVLGAMMALDQNLLMGGTLGVELLNHLSKHALLHLLLNATMGASMHDPEFAYADPELAAVNGVGGSSWDGFRRKAWLTKEYAMMDLCFHGYNYVHTKEDVSVAAGFTEGAFYQMGEQTWALVREVLLDFDPEYWDLCFDVCSSSYLGQMAKALGRHVPTDAIPSTIPAQKALGGQYDFYFALPKLALVLLSTRWDGAYKDKDGKVNHKNQGRTGAAIVLVLLPNGGFLLRAYELAPPHRRDFAGMQGSHLIRTHLVYALTGAIDDAAVERAMPMFEARLERAREALRCRAAGIPFEAIEGARRLADSAVLVDLDAEYVADWRTHSALEWTMEAELRPGSTAHMRALAEQDPRARCLANLAPVHAAALRPPALTMRDALGLRALDHRPSRASCLYGGAARGRGTAGAHSRGCT